jgi:hypothetical protein
MAVSFHRGYSLLNPIVYIGKLGDTDHAKDFFKMFGEARYSDLLFILLGMSQNLDKDSNTTTVNIRLLIELDQDLGDISLVVEILVGLVDKGFGLGGDIALDVHQRDIVLSLQLNFVYLFHSQHEPYRFS